MPDSKFPRPLPVLMPALCAASFFERAVTLAAAGRPSMLLGLAALFSGIAAVAAARRNGPLWLPKPWCRIVPDPVNFDKSALRRGLRLAAEEAETRGSDVWVELLPQFDAAGNSAPYGIVIDPFGNHTGKRPRPPESGAIVVPLPGVDVPRATMGFRVESPEGVRVRFRPKSGRPSGAGTVELWHDASPPRTRAGWRVPVVLGTSAGLLAWNLGRFSPYADTVPPPGLPVVLGIALAGLVAAAGHPGYFRKFRL